MTYLLDMKLIPTFDAPWLVSAYMVFALNYSGPEGVVTRAASALQPDLCIARFIYPHLPAMPAMCQSSSLADFWGRRWNVPTSHLLRVVVYDPIVQGEGHSYCLFKPGLSTCPG